MYSMPGAWNNFDNLEESLTFDELYKLIEKAREQRFQNQKFQAAIQGIDLEDNASEDSDFKEVERRANARATGLSEEQLELDGFFNIIDEDE